MIKNIRFLKNGKIRYGMCGDRVTGPEQVYTWKLPFFVEHSSVQLKPGITVLVGPNGSGKSTFLKLLAYETTCLQKGGWMQPLDPGDIAGKNGSYESRIAVQNGSLRNPFFGRGKLDWDGAPVAYINGASAHQTPSFIDTMEDITQIFTLGKTSSGQRALLALGQLNDLLGKCPFFRNRPDAKKLGVNETWQNSLLNWWDWIHDKQKAAGILLKPVPTILMDEPDGHLDIPNQQKFWEKIAELATKKTLPAQLIIATHSPLAIRCYDKLNFIEFSPGYLRDALAVFGLPTPKQEKDSLGIEL